MADFNYFLLQIANEIESIELADMKFLCKGDDTLARDKLERVETARELLNFLKESGKIGPGNVMYLVTLLDRVNLVRLAERAMEEGKKSIFTGVLRKLRPYSLCFFIITSLLEVKWL